MKWLLLSFAVALVSCSTSTTVVNHDRKVGFVRVKKDRTVIKKKKVKILNKVWINLNYKSLIKINRYQSTSFFCFNPYFVDVGCFIRLHPI